jgi:Ca2+-binding EF-hand superfamily protein
LLVFNQSCKKDTPIELQTKTILVSNEKWTKTSSYIIKGEVLDFKELENRNLALLSDNYYVFDSNLNVVLTDNLFQSIPDFMPKRLSNPFYTNQRSFIENKQYLNLNYFDKVTGIINNKIVVELKSLIGVPENGYAILLDDKEDKILNKSVKLFLKTEFDTVTGIGTQFNVFTGNDINSQRKSFENVSDNRFGRIASNKKGYLLYSLNSSLLRFLNPGLQVIDTNIYQSRPEKVFVSENKFFIQNNYGLFSTENGIEFLQTTNNFKAKCILSNDYMFGVMDKKTCILKLNNGSIQYLPILGLTENIIMGKIEVISFDNKIAIFTQEGVFQIKY